MFDLVSILIPAYNAEKWISDTIKSALNQTWPRKEIIIVDDGSTDNTLQIAREFESKSVKVITQENRGACNARNKALEFSQGDYIQWLDADDLLDPDKVSRQLIESKNGRGSRILLTSAFGTFFYRPQKAKFIPNSLWQDLKPIDWILKKFTDNVWMNPATWLVSRSLAELVGPWDERLYWDQDGEYICRVVVESENVKFVKEAKCYYRIGNFSSINSSISDKMIESLYLSLSLCFDQVRSLEDSKRVKVACLKYLQTWFDLFYPEKHELLQKANDLARDLGGSLSPPSVGWKYFLINKMFGSKITQKVQRAVRKSKILAHKNWDKLIYKLAN